MFFKLSRDFTFCAEEKMIVTMIVRLYTHFLSPQSMVSAGYILWAGKI